MASDSIPPSSSASSNSSTRSFFQSGKTAVVTGASSGIGKAACLEFASSSMKFACIWMIDIDEKDLAEAHDEVLCMAKKNNENQVVEKRLVDVSDMDAMKALADEVFSSHGGKCHVLMNNAGTGIGGGALTDINMLQKVMNVNTYGPIHGCLNFVPHLVKQTDEESIIINTGSKQGITAPPGNLAYNMSKAALKCYTEGLCHEMRNNSPHVKVALLIPGWVNTSIVLKTQRAAKNDDDSFDVAQVPFHEGKPAAGAWMPSQIIQFMISELNNHKDRFYIICPDNDVSRQVDNLRMTWAMQDLTQDRPPLSRWHPDYKDQFQEFLQANMKE